MRRAGPIVVLLLIAAGCDRPRKAEPAPDIVAIRVSPADTPVYRAIARRCGAAGTRLQRAGEATLLVVGRDSSLAARDCFFAGTRAEYRRQHPIAGFVEGLFR